MRNLLQAPITLNYEVDAAYLRWIAKLAQTDCVTLHYRDDMQFISDYIKTCFREEGHMKYQRNDRMEYIPVDEDSLAVFDADSGETMFLDGTGVEILEFLEQPMTLPELIQRLKKTENSKIKIPEDLEERVQRFLKGAMEAKVVVAV